jgi:hypothetical protein
VRLRINAQCLKICFMWPFSPKSPAPCPSVTKGEVRAWWDAQAKCWDIRDGVHDYSVNSAELDIALFDQLPTVRELLQDLDSDIDAEIRKRFEGPQSFEGTLDWSGKKEVVCIYLSEFFSKQEVEVAYAGDDEWGDLLVTVLIRDRKVVGSYADD